MPTAPAPKSDTRPRVYRHTPAFKLQALASLMGRKADAVSEQVGLRMDEGHILAAVARARHLSLRDVCAETGMDKSKASRLIARLVDAGFLERLDDPQDQRSFSLMLTPAGEQINARINAAAVACNDEWLAPLSPADLKRFSALLDVLTSQAQKILDSPLPPAAQPPAGREGAGDSAARPGRSLLVPLNTLQALRRQIDDLLGAG